MSRGMVAALAVAAGTALVGIPALARAQQDPPATGSFTAEDVGGTTSGRWDANGDPSTSSLTILSGGTVTFSYPAGASHHNVTFTSAAKPSCSGLPPGSDFTAWGPGWTATCEFDHAGTYTFVCPLHSAMTGTVTVRDAAPAPQPTYGASPTPTPPAAVPTPTPPPSPQSALKVTLHARQAGSHVRGSVLVQSARTRVEANAYAALTHGKAARVGGWLRRSAPAGRVAFSVPLNARARKALRQRHRLAVTLKVALTPPGGHALHHTAKITVRPG